jgi:hypothetical protein
MLFSFMIDLAFIMGNTQSHFLRELLIFFFPYFQLFLSFRNLLHLFILFLCISSFLVLPFFSFSFNKLFLLQQLHPMSLEFLLLLSLILRYLFNLCFDLLNRLLALFFNILFFLLELLTQSLNFFLKLELALL